jgi:hypothetical protein
MGGRCQQNEDLKIRAPRRVWVDNSEMKNAVFWGVAPCRCSSLVEKATEFSF